MSDVQGGTAGGLLSALKSMAATLLASGKTRLELIANELQVEKLRTIQLVLMAMAMVFCFGLALILGVALLVALFWEQRLLLLGIFSGLFLALAGFFLYRFKQATRRPDKMFAASLAELQEDLRQLRAMVGHEPPAR